MAEPVSRDDVAASPRLGIPRLLSALGGPVRPDAAVPPRGPGPRRPDGNPMPSGSPRPAAVLVLFSDVENPDLTFIERSATLRHHPGQIAFPGGGVDPGETAVEAALREAWEEILLDPAAVTVRTALPASNVAAYFFDVTAIVATWTGQVPLGVGDPPVAAVFRYGLTELADPANRVLATIPGGYRGPAFVMGDVFIWGFTANIVDYLLELGGWARPWSRSRTLPVPERYFREASRGPARATTWADSAE